MSLDLESYCLIRETKMSTINGMKHKQNVDVIMMYSDYVGVILPIIPNQTTRLQCQIL